MCCRRLGILKRTRSRKNAPCINYSVQCQYTLLAQSVEQPPSSFSPSSHTSMGTPYTDVAQLADASDLRSEKLWVRGPPSVPRRSTLRTAQKRRFRKCRPFFGCASGLLLSPSNHASMGASLGRVPESGQTGRTVNPLANACVGSNPTSPTKKEFK